MGKKRKHDGDLSRLYILPKGTMIRDIAHPHKKDVNDSRDYELTRRFKSDKEYLEFLNSECAEAEKYLRAQKFGLALKLRQIVKHPIDFEGEKHRDPNELDRYPIAITSRGVTVDSGSMIAWYLAYGYTAPLHFAEERRTVPSYRGPES